MFSGVLFKRGEVALVFRAVIFQTLFQLRQKGSLCVFYILSGLVLYNFVENVLDFQGRDVIEMYHPMKMLLLSYNRVSYKGDNFLLLVQLYPLLVVIPASFFLTKEHQTGQEVYIASRIGVRAYKFSKLISAFFSTFVVFTVPFLLEFLLNCLSFPCGATGDMSNWGYYDSRYIDSVHHYLFTNLYLHSPYFYAFLMIILFGAVSGCLSAFTVAFSSVVNVKYNIFLFLPVFLLLHAGIILGAFYPANKASISWYDYISLFNDKIKNPIYLLFAMFLIIICSITMVYASSRKDCL